MKLIKGKFEKIKKLKIQAPNRYLCFIVEYCEITDLDFKSAMHDMIVASIVMFIEDLDAKDRIRLVKKYHLSDIYEIPSGVWKEAAGIPSTVKPISDPWKNIACRVSNLLVNNPRFKESYNRYQADAIIKALEELTPDAKAEIRAVILNLGEQRT